MSTRRAWMWLLCSALFVASCNCGGKSGTGTGTADAAKKVFRFYRSSTHKSLDPILQFDQASAEIVMNVYDTVLEYHYLKRPYTMVPNLLAKMPELSADRLTYTFELRKDVKFIDDPCFPGGKGRPLVADDVIYSLKRFASVKNVKSYSLMQGIVAGMDAFREETSKGGDINKLAITGLKKVDDQHFTMTLTAPSPLALYPLAATQTSIVAREAVEHYKDDFENHPVGTGPFILTKMERRGVAILSRNPNYHGVYPSEGGPGDAEAGLLKDAGKKLPFIDEVQLPLIEETQPQMLKFQSKGLDWVAVDRDNFVKYAMKDETGFHLQPAYVGQFEIYTEPTLSTEYISFNMNDPVVGKNKALRQAIAYALNNKDYIDQLLNGRGIVLQTIVPPGIAGSQADLKQLEWYPNNLELAKQKMAEAGFPGGKGAPELTIEYRNSTTRTRQDYEWNRNELAKIGLVLKPSFNTFTAYLQRVEQGNFQVANSAWGADYPDAENFYQLLYSKNKPPGSNQSAYDNPEYDKLFEQSRFMPNGPERFAIFEKMHAILKDNVPITPQFTPVAVGFRQNWIRNFKRNSQLDMPFKYFDVDNAAKAKAGAQ